MPRNMGPYNPPSWDERFRGITSFALTIGAFTLGYNQTDEKWVAACIIAGILFMLTTLAIVFEKVDTIDG